MKNSDFKIEKLLCRDEYKVVVKRPFDSIEEAQNFIDGIVESDEKLERSITWSVEDIRGRAEEQAEWFGQSIEERFDTSKFEVVLDQMIRKHDCNIGISWDTIDVFLDMYAKRK